MRINLCGLKLESTEYEMRQESEMENRSYKKLLEQWQARCSLTVILFTNIARDRVSTVDLVQLDDTCIYLENAEN